MGGWGEGQWGPIFKFCIVDLLPLILKQEKNIEGPDKGHACFLLHSFRAYLFEIGAFECSVGNFCALVSNGNFEALRVGVLSFGDPKR